MFNARTVLGALAFTALLSGQARAQAAQTWSLLGSPFFTVQKFGAGNVAGAGVELQLRYSRPGTSVGLGFQYSSHTSANDNMKVTGLFLEPRYAPDIGSESLVPYIAGRLAVLQQTSNFATSSTGYAAGVGGGVMYKLSRTVNLDLGAAVVRQSFGDVTLDDGRAARFEAFFGYVAKVGLSIGFRR